MTRIVTIHQPNYLPWVGLFSKIMYSDCLIIYDNAQYIKNSVINRNKIRTLKGFHYLTIPLGDKQCGARIFDVTLPKETGWQKNHWKMIYDNYTKTDFFNHHVDFFKELYQKQFKYLWEINESILLYLLKCFEINVEVVKTSELAVDSSLFKTDLMLAYLKKGGADLYLSGPSGRNYLETDKFTQNNIKLKFFNFQHPVYQQRYPGFVSHLSAIDLLFNKGPAARELIKSSGHIED